MNQIDIEDMARYIAKRAGCSYEDGVDYQYSQRDYMDSLGLINWDVESIEECIQTDIAVCIDNDDMCQFIADDTGIKPHICKKLNMAEMEYLRVLGLVDANPLDELDQLTLKLNDNQRKDALAAIDVIISD